MATKRSFVAVDLSEPHIVSTTSVKAAFSSEGHNSWTDKRFTDAEVLCDGQTWEVHRVILSTHSEYFRRVFNLKTGKDAYTAIDLNLEEEPPLIEAMLKFMYTHDYPSVAQESLLFHAKMFRLGQVYQIQTLRANAVKSFRFSLNAYIGGSEVYSWGDFAAGVKLAFGESKGDGNGLRKCIVTGCAFGLMSMREAEHFEKLYSVDVPELGAAILKRLVDEAGHPLDRSTCQLCGNTWESGRPRTGLSQVCQKGCPEKRAKTKKER